MHSAAPSTRIIPFVAFIVFVDMCGLGLVIPVLPSLITRLTHVTLDRAAELGGLLALAYALMQFLFAPIIGGLSDRFGRRPVLLGTLAALGFDYALMAFAPSFAWLFAGRVVAGLMGASWAAANSCVADTVSPEARGRAFGLLGAGGAAGFVMGPAIGGVLGQFGDRAPFVAACVLVLTGALVGYRLLPETLAPERRRRFTLARANPLGSLIQMARTPLVPGFLVAIFFMQLASTSTFSVWSFYTILKFGWTPLTIGLSLAMFGALVAVVQGVFTGRAITRWGEARTGLAGLLIASPAYLIFAFAPYGWVMFVGILLGTAGNVTFPAMQAMMSRAVPVDAQGELQGAIASIMGITAIIGPPLMSNVFGAYADAKGLFFPGAPFMVAAALMVATIISYALNVRRYARRVAH